MRPIRCSCINGRIGTICVGVLYTILWIICTCWLGIGIFPPHIDNVGRRVFLVAPMYALFIYSMGSSAISALMIFGVMKRTASYIFPWLAVHFVLTTFSIAVSFCDIIITMLDESKGNMLTVVPSRIFVPAVLTVSWVVAYRHCKSLVSPMQVHPTYVGECKILESPEEPARINQPA